MINHILNTKSYKIIFASLTFICVSSTYADNNNDAFDAQDTYTAVNDNGDKFDVQKFINSDEMYSFIFVDNSVKLFTIEKSTNPDLNSSDSNHANCGPYGKELSCTTFKNFNLNEANLFAKQNDSTRVYFDRLYQSVATMPVSGWLTSNVDPYNIGVYPVQHALNKVVKECGLKDEKLTNLSINKPGSYLPTIIYVITTKNKNGICNQALFDTYRKNVSCLAMENVDCYL